MKLQKNKSFYFALGAVALATTIPVISTLSCNNKRLSIDNDFGNDDNNNDFVVDDTNNNEDNSNNKEPIEPKIQWIQGYRKNEQILFNTTDDFLFNINDEIFEDQKYRIKYVGDESKIPCFSLYDKNINRYYLVSYQYDYDDLKYNNSLSKAKNYLSTEIIKDYEKNMIIKYLISDKDFFVPVDTSDKSIDFISNSTVSVQSSWGVGNSSSRSISFRININRTKIREILFGAFEQNYDNLFLESTELTDLYLFPDVVSINFPINYIDFNIDTVKNNANEKFLDLTKDEKSKLSMVIPGKSGVSSQYWSGKINNKLFSGQILATNYLNGISAPIITMIDANNTNYADVLDRINNSNKSNVNNYVSNIIQNGKKISINYGEEFGNQLDQSFSFDISSTLSAGANAGAIFGDWTEVGIYNISGIQKMKLEFKEYKKF